MTRYEQLSAKKRSRPSESMNGYTKKDYLKAKNEYDEIINDLYFKTENMVFDSINEIKGIMQDNFLKNLI